MQDDISTLDVATSDSRHAIALILDAAVNAYSPQDPELRGVELALGAILSMDGPPADHVLRRAFHRAGMFDNERLAHAVDHAAMAFWNQVAACYPEIGSGDLDAATDATLLGAMTAATKTWLEMNA